MANSLILTKAQNAVTAHDWTTAARLYKELLRGDESNVEYLQQLGSIYVRGGQDEKAIPYYEQIITFNPNNTQAMVSLGGIYRRLKRYEDSVNILHKAQDIESSSPTINYNLGFTYKEMGDYDDAIDSFESVISRNPDDVLAHNHLGSIYFAKKEYEKSIAAYKHGLQVDQNHPILNFNLAHVYEEMRNYPESVRCYEIALKTRPGWVEAIRDFSELLIKCQNTKQAQELVEQSIKLHPDDVDLLCILGRIYLNQFDYDNATKTFKRAERLKENDINILIGLSKSLEKGTKIDQAMEKILEAVDIAPENLEVCKQYAHVLLSAQRYEKALDLIKTIDSKSDGKDLQILDLYGQYFVCRGDEEAANTYFERIKKLNHHYKDYLINAADRYIQTGNYEKAEKLAESFVERRPQLPEGYNILGTVQVARGDLSKAKAEYEKGISLKNPNIYAVKELEKIYSELEKNQELYDDDKLPVGLDADKLSKDEGGNLDDDKLIAGEDNSDEQFDALLENGENQEEEKEEHDYSSLEREPPIEQALTGEDGDFWEDFDDDPDAKEKLIDEEEEEEPYDENSDNSDLMSMMTPGAAEEEEEENSGLDMDPEYEPLKAAEAKPAAEAEPEVEPELESEAEPEATPEAEFEGEHEPDLASLADDDSDFSFGSDPVAEQETEPEPVVDEPPVREPQTREPEYKQEPDYDLKPELEKADKMMQDLKQQQKELELQQREFALQQKEFADEMKHENEKMIHEAVDKAVDEAVDKAVEEKLQEYDLPVEAENEEPVIAEPEVVEAEVTEPEPVETESENAESDIPEDDFDLNLYDAEFSAAELDEPEEEVEAVEADAEPDIEFDYEPEVEPEPEPASEVEAEPEEETVPEPELEVEPEEESEAPVETPAEEVEASEKESGIEEELLLDDDEGPGIVPFITVEELRELCGGSTPADLKIEEEPAVYETAVQEEDDDLFVTADDMLDKIERILNDDDTAKNYSAEIELFKKLKVLASYMPEKEKNSSFSCKMRMLMEYVIARMSGKPGLLRTAESLIKSGVLGEEYNSQLDELEDEELTNDLIIRVIKDMKDMAQNLEDKELCNALCITADGILEQISLINQKCAIF